jgi:hypothetical protein
MVKKVPLVFVVGPLGFEPSISGDVSRNSLFFPTFIV